MRTLSFVSNTSFQNDCLINCVVFCSTCIVYLLFHLAPVRYYLHCAFILPSDKYRTVYTIYFLDKVLWNTLFNLFLFEIKSYKAVSTIYSIGDKVLQSRLYNLFPFEIKSYNAFYTIYFCALYLLFYNCAFLYPTHYLNEFFLHISFFNILVLYDCV